MQAAGGTLRDGQAYAVDGQRPETNNFLIDGSDNFNSVAGGFVLKRLCTQSPSSASSRTSQQRRLVQFAQKFLF